jgi:hypothetical protein
LTVRVSLNPAYITDVGMKPQSSFAERSKHTALKFPKYPVEKVSG